MNAAEIGAGMKSIREAHRYCTNKDHGGHDFEECPMYRDFKKMVELPLTLERERAQNRSAEDYRELSFFGRTRRCE